MTVAARIGVAPRLLVVAILNVAVSTQPIFLASAAIEDMGTEIGYGEAGLGVLTAVYFVTAGLFSARLGAVVERFGWRRSIRRNALGSSAVLLAMSLGVRSMPTLVAGLFAGAVIYGLANPAANQALAHHGEENRRGILFGIKHAGIPTSTLIAGLALPLIVDPFGWRVAYGVSAVIGVVVFLLVPRGDAAVHDSPSRRPSHPDLLDRTSLRLTATGGFLASAAPAALGSFTVAAALDRGFTETSAGLLFAVASVSSILARIGHGAAIDRRPGNGFHRMAALLAIGGIVLILTSLETPAPVFTAVVTIAFATAWAWPGLLTYTVVGMNPSTPAASTGVTQAGVFFGAGGMPIVIGAIAETHGFAWIWLLVGAMVTVGAVVMWMLGRRHPPA